MKIIINKIFLVMLLVPVIFACVLVGHAKADGLNVSPCQISPSATLLSPANLNTPLTFTAVVSGGTGNYTYTWTDGCEGGSNTCQASFSSAGTYTAFVQVTDGNETETSSCSAYIATPQQTCTPQDHKACVGNSAYWYDSCNNQGALYQNCTTTNQTCSNGSCISQQTGACSSNSDCGSNSYTGSPFCQGNSIYQNYITWTCNNPGTASSTCTSATAAQFTSTCSGNQTCNGGSCNGSSCIQDQYQQCVGNNLYWYDSCGDQDGVSQYCPNGCSGNSCTNNYGYMTVQTDPPTNVSGGQATFNGTYSTTSSNYSYNTYVWFQYGTTTSYGSETSRQIQNYSGLFSQTVSNLYSGTYHIRAVAQQCSGNSISGQYYCSGNTVYGQDVVINAASTAGNLTATKTVRNLTNGSGFASSAYASPSDTLMFMITLQATNQDVQNVVVRDSLPANLIYNNQLIVACTSNNNNYSNCSGTNYNYSGSIASGINLGTVYAGQTVTITYQVQVAGDQNFAYGSTTLNNNVSVTSSSQNNPTSSASVIVTKGQVLGASSISTGLTNNFWSDSFFLPLLIALFSIWMLKSGMFFGFEKWIDNKKRQHRGYKAEKELNARIAKIRKEGNA